MNDQDGGRLDDPAFWRDLQETFENALTLLREIAESRGVDADTLETKFASAEEVTDREAREHPLTRSAAEYAQRVNRWFQRAKGRIQDWGREAAIAADLDAVTPDLQAEVSAMQEAVETIAEQRHRIQVKLMRALREQRRAQDDLPGGGDGGTTAARQACDGVQRSIDMWLRMRNFFPEEEDAILNLLVHLASLRSSIPGQFPAIDPGSD